MTEPERPERRESRTRRNLNDMVRSPDGKISEAKVGAVLFKIAMLAVFVRNTELVLKDWAILSVFVATFVAPDILKKFLMVKAGGEK